MEPDYIVLSLAKEFPKLVVEPFADKQFVMVQVRNASPAKKAENVYVQLYVQYPGQEPKPLGAPLPLGDIEAGRFAVTGTFWDLDGRNVERTGLSAQAFIPDVDDKNPDDNVAGIECTISYAHNGSRAYSWVDDAYRFENYGFEQRETEELVEGILATAAGAMEGSKEKQSLWMRLVFPQTYTRLVKYLETSFTQAAGGHCYGMSATSALYFEDGSLKPVAKPVPSMTKTEASTNINLYHRAQMISILDAVLTGEQFQKRKFGVAQTLGDIRSSLKDNRRCPIIEFFGTINGQGAGHAVLAYKLIEVEGREPVVYVYDSNFPLSKASPPKPMSQIILKPGKNTWSNPVYMGYDWADATLISAKTVNRTISVAAVNALVPGLKKSASETLAILDKLKKIMAVLRCPADAVFTDPEGRRTGTVSGRTVNEIPGAEVVASGEVEIYYLPAGVQYAVQLAATGSGKAAFDVIRAESATRGAVTSFDEMELSGAGALKGTIRASGELPGLTGGGAGYMPSLDGKLDVGSGAPHPTVGSAGQGVPSGGVKLEWTFVDDPSPSQASAWSWKAGKLEQSSNVYRVDREYDFWQGTHAVAGSPGWDDYELRCRMTPTDNDGVGAIVRYQDGNNYYRFIMVDDPGNRGPFRRLEKFAGGQRTVLAEVREGFQSGKAYDLRFRASGAHLEVWLDGKRILAADDGAFRKGSVGFLTYACSVVIENIAVAPLK